jgi:opacity protein-like surface antigen
MSKNKAASYFSCLLILVALQPVTLSQESASVWQGGTNVESYDEIVGFEQPSIPNVEFFGKQRASPSGLGVYYSVISGWSELDKFVAQPPARPGPRASSRLNSSARIAGPIQGPVQGPPVTLPAPPAIGRFNDGFLLGAAMGVSLNRNNRIEAEGVWRSNAGRQTTSDAANIGQFDSLPLDGHLNNYSAMLNCVHDFRSFGASNLYGGLGIGASKIDGQFDSSLGEINIDDWLFAYQAILGIKLRATDRLNLNVEYRYFGNSESKIEIPIVDNPGLDYIAENITFGLSFTR